MSDDELFELPVSQHWEEADKVRLGRNVRDLRVASGLSQTALADAMRVAGLEHWRQTTVSRIERGTQVINMGELKALEAIVGEGVLRGTELEEGMRKAGRRIHDAYVRVKLGLADQALTDTIEQAETARFQVRQLRYLFDADFAAKHPEAGGHDGQHQEAP